LTAYANRISNYIYLSPTDQQVVSLRGTFNVFEYLQKDARLLGLDLSANYMLVSGLETYARGSIIRAKNLTEDNYLPFIPADRLESGLRFKYLQKSKTPSSFNLSTTLVAKQTREPEFDLAPAPAGYMIWNAGFQTERSPHRDQLIQSGL
jgi:iron complex outermembrane receptor protein